MPPLLPPRTRKFDTVWFCPSSTPVNSGAILPPSAFCMVAPAKSISSSIRNVPAGLAEILSINSCADAICMI